MFEENNEVPIVSIVGSSGAGKTTLLEKLIPELKSRGIKVGTIKHHMHEFQMDKPGKDTWRHKQAGASITVISSPSQIGLVMDVDHDYTLDELALLVVGVDIVLTEGYRRDSKRKLEVFRPEVSEHPLCKDDKLLTALISDTEIDLGVPRFSTDDISGLADFLIRYFKIIPAISFQTGGAELESDYP